MIVQEQVCPNCKNAITAILAHLQQEEVDLVICVSCYKIIAIEDGIVRKLTKQEQLALNRKPNTNLVRTELEILARERMVS